MTFKEAYDYGVEQLQQAEVTDAKGDSFYLLEHVTGMNRGRYYVMNQQEMPQEEKKKYLALIQKRAKRIPLQHLIGRTEFMGLSFTVSSQVLIPRQDTECLVETALEWINQSLGRELDQIGAEKVGGDELRILDMCTGSGCILISILHHSPKEFSKIEGVGVDISPQALEIAKENAKNNGLWSTRNTESQVAFIESDLFAKLDKKEKFHMIVSNPPYIPTKEIKGLEEEVRCYDPIMALDGKEDGLHFYRKIIEKSPYYLAEGGVLMVECGWNQGEEVSQIMRENRFSQVKAIKDLNGRDRVVVGSQ